MLIFTSEQTPFQPQSTSCDLTLLILAPKPSMQPAAAIKKKNPHISPTFNLHIPLSNKMVLEKVDSWERCTMEDNSHRHKLKHWKFWLDIGFFVRTIKQQNGIKEAVGFLFFLSFFFPPQMLLINWTKSWVTSYKLAQPWAGGQGLFHPSLLYDLSWLYLEPYHRTLVNVKTQL